MNESEVMKGRQAASLTPSTWLVCNKVDCRAQEFKVPDQETLDILPKLNVFVEKEMWYVSGKTHCHPGSSSVFLCSDGSCEMDLLCSRHLCCLGLAFCLCKMG